MPLWWFNIENWNTNFLCDNKRPQHHISFTLKCSLKSWPWIDLFPNDRNTPRKIGRTRRDVLNRDPPIITANWTQVTLLRRVHIFWRRESVSALAAETRSPFPIKQNSITSRVRGGEIRFCWEFNNKIWLSLTSLAVELKRAKRPVVRRYWI